MLRYLRRPRRECSTAPLGRFLRCIHQALGNLRRLGEQTTFAGHAQLLAASAQVPLDCVRPASIEVATS